LGWWRRCHASRGSRCGGPPQTEAAERLVVGVALDQLKPAVLAGGTHVGPTGGVALVLPPMPTWAMTAVIAGWVIGWLVIGAAAMATRDA
jgi:hypothetical protein